RAIEAHAAGALAEADALAREIVAAEPADPTDAAWRIARARALATLDRQPAAIAAYDEAIALMPDNHEFHRGPAFALLADRQYEAALAGWNAALALAPDAVDYHVMRGETLRRLGLLEAAMAALDRAIEIQEDCADAWYSKALLLLSMGRYAE